MTDVDAFFERWLAEEVAERPVLASRLGLDGYDDQLGDLRSFHDTIAGSGCLPLALAERAVLAD